MPFVKPATVHDNVTDEHVFPLGDDVTVYDVIGAPPVDAGADHNTNASVSPAVALTEVGDDGTSHVTTAADATDVVEPTAFVAVTVNVYDVPRVRPEQDAVSPVTTHDPPAGDEVTVYPVIGEPPSEEGATHDTTADPLPATAVTNVGADGTVAGITALLTPAAEEPARFCAVTLNVYEVPFVKPEHAADVPVTTHDPPAGDEVTV